MAKKQQIDAKLIEIDDLENKVAEHYELLKLGRELLSQYEAVEKNGSMIDLNDFFADMSLIQRKALEVASIEQYERQQSKINSENERERRKAKIFAKELKHALSGVNTGNNKNTKKHKNTSISITLTKLRDEFVNDKCLLMKLSRLHRNVSQTRIEQSHRQLRFPKSAVEAITELVQIFLQIPRRNSMKRAVQKLLHVADHDMNQGQPLGSFLRWRHLFLVNMFPGHRIQRRQGICSDMLARLQVEGEERPHGSFTNGVNGLHRYKSCAFFSGFHGYKHRLFSFSPSASLAGSFPANVGIIKLNELLQPVNAVSMSHGGANLLQHVPSTEPGNADMLGKSQGRDASFVRGHEINRPKPFDQRYLRGMKDRVGSDRHLVPAGRALIEFARCDKAVVLRSAGRTLKALWPADFLQSFDASSFCPESFLPFYKRDSRHFHGKTSWVRATSCSCMKI